MPGGFKTVPLVYVQNMINVIDRGDFVIEYVGEVVSQSQMQKRLEINAQLGQKHYYFMTLQSDQVIILHYSMYHAAFCWHRF